WRETIKLTEHRYMLEDVGIGLSFLASVARLAAVATPLVDAFLALGSAICGEDFQRTGRPLASLGLAELGPAELGAFMERGFRRARGPRWPAWRRGAWPAASPWYLPMRGMASAFST